MDNEIEVNRKTLKSYFVSGSVPTEKEFATLIDSVSNIVEDGKVKIGVNGLILYPQDDIRKGVIEIYDDKNQKPWWTIAISENDGRLLFRNNEAEEVLSLSQDGCLIMSEKIISNMFYGNLMRGNISVEIRDLASTILIDKIPHIAKYVINLYHLNVLYEVNVFIDKKRNIFDIKPSSLEISLNNEYVSFNYDNNTIIATYSVIKGEPSRSLATIGIQTTLYMMIESIKP